GFSPWSRPQIRTLTTVLSKLRINIRNPISGPSGVPFLCHCQKWVLGSSSKLFLSPAFVLSLISARSASALCGLAAPVGLCLSKSQVPIQISSPDSGFGSKCLVLSGS
uniref:Uncharacterized protein n=1 Tax=Cannabis sativa TaxID=3483 RepID=A0A803QRI4_CANSA